MTSYDSKTSYRPRVGLGGGEGVPTPPIQGTYPPSKVPTPHPRYLPLCSRYLPPSKVPTPPHKVPTPRPRYLPPHPRYLPPPHKVPTPRPRYLPPIEGTYPHPRYLALPVQGTYPLPQDRTVYGVLHTPQSVQWRI